MSTQNDVKTPSSAAMRAAERICERLGYGAHHVDAYEWAARIADAEFAPLLQAADALAEAAKWAIECWDSAERNQGWSGDESELCGQERMLAFYRAAIAAYRELRGA